MRSLSTLFEDWELRGAVRFLPSVCKKRIDEPQSFLASLFRPEPPQTSTPIFSTQVHQNCRDLGLPPLHATGQPTPAKAQHRNRSMWQASTFPQM
jgi:hypothetical protein